MEAGDADVVHPIDLVAHDLRGDGRFFRDGQVGRPGGRDDNDAPSGGAFPATRDRPGELVKDGVGHFLPDSVERARVSPRNQQAVTRGDDALGDGGDLLGRLAGTEDYLRKSLPEWRWWSTRANPRSSNGAWRRN